MRNKAFLNYIIDRIDTVTSRTKGTSGNKNFKVDQETVDNFGTDVIMETLSELSEIMPDSISVKWRYTEIRKTDVISFSVRKESIEDLYRVAGRKSSTSILDCARAKIMRQADNCSIQWLKDTYYKGRLKQIENGTIPKHTDDDTFDTVLNAVAGNKRDIYERVFSSEVLHRSKAFMDDYKTSVCSVLRRCYPLFDKDGNLSDNDVLRHFGILTYNNCFEFKGNISFTTDGINGTTESEIYGTVWNTETICHSHITGAEGIRRILTVENKANYNAEPYAPDTIVIYSNGFPPPSSARLMKEIYKCVPRAVYEHWGDMDYGGIRIFKYIKENIFPGLKPYKMDAETYTECISKYSGYKLKPSVIEKLKEYDAGELNGLKEKLLAYGIGFEQEDMLLQI